jgi:precorrin-6A/cobalt-precorrin-6A reductase
LDRGLTIGRQDLAIFAHLREIWFLMRMVEPPDAETAIPQGKLLFERGPFTDADEQMLLIEYGIEAIVTKNSGGDAVEAKLRAAQMLGIPVLMVQRPQLPNGEQVSTIEDALLWIINNGKLQITPQNII